MDNWADEPESPAHEYRRSVVRRSGGLGREQRFMITLGATAALMLLIGLATGFATGRATAPKPKPARVAVVAVATQPPEATTTADVSTVSADTTIPADVTTPAPAPQPAAPKKPIKTPNQTAPDDYAKLSSSTVTLRWTKVSDPAGGKVTYAFDIQTWNGSAYGPSQTIRGLTSTSYKARVLASRRRWRVWAVDSSGKASAKSSWSRYSRAATKSSTTTGTAQ